jgi:hypothetical protein
LMVGAGLRSEQETVEFGFPPVAAVGVEKQR